MAIGKPRSARRSGARGSWRPVCLSAILAVLLGLGACYPVEAWRDLTGASKNDPDPETTPNTRNLAAGEASDYPNLATVPPPPTQTLTAAEREKLAQSLIADRANAKYSDEKLRAGFPAASAPPPPPPPALAPAETAKPVATDSAPAAAPGSEPAAGKGASGPGQGLRKQGEPPEPGPMESSLEVPQPRATPQPEQIQPAPPPPSLVSTPPPAAGGTGATAYLPPPPAPAPLPAALGSAAYQAPPPPPSLPPPAAAGSGKGAQEPAAKAVGTPVAEVRFAADSTTLNEADRQTLEKVVPLYQQNPGKLRVVGYASAGSGAAEQLNSFRAALDRAQTVAAALTAAGIPSDKIQLEAAPAGTDSGESRAEVLLEH